jgi:tetratricopeptide (TPR) repeat protein
MSGARSIHGRSAARLAGALVLALCLARSALAQAPLAPDPGVPVAPAPAKGGMPAVDGSCDEAEALGGTTLERAAACAALSRGELVSARNLADRALKEDEGSYRAHFLMGYVQHLGEGNLPKSLNHLERAEKLLVASHGERPSPDDPAAAALHRILRELVYVHGEMDHHEEKIAYVQALYDRLGLDYRPLAAWPLLKLKRFDEARVLATAAAADEKPWYRAVGLTALCAIDSELRDRMGAYRACVAAAAPVMEADDLSGAIELSNAGAASEEVFRFDEAERYYQAATRKAPEGSVNPWGRLTRLYLRQGRFAEALSAWREMRAYRARRPGSYLDQQDQSDAELIGASVLLVAGKLEEAEKITRRTVQRPDRQGTSSAAAEQNEAGAAITDRVAKLSAARLLESQAAVARFWDGLALRARALRLRFEAWLLGRRAAVVLADRERLVTSLRPECPGSLELPSWLDADLIPLVGPGVARATLTLARAEETLESRLTEPIFRGFEAEAALLAGEDDAALEAARATLAGLSPAEVMLRARAAAIGAEAARRLGDADAALGLYRVVLASDPGVLRRLGFPLPVRVSSAGAGAAARAAELLEGAAMFVDEDWGLGLTVGEEQAFLALPDGSMLTSVTVPAGREEDTEAVARRIAKAVVDELLVPSLDVTQADIRSLDGSLGSGGKASERVKSVLEDLR